MERATLDRLLTVASSQLGLFTIRQAASVGVTRQMVRAAVVRGWIRQERRGVYAVSGVPSSHWQRVYAAALAAGPPLMVSHSSAAIRHPLFGIAAEGIELTVPGNIHRRIHGVTVHRSSTVLPGDVQYRDGIAMTTPVRTLIDLAERLSAPLLGRVVDEGAVSRLFTAEMVMARLDRYGLSAPGHAELRRVVQTRLNEGQPDSVLEQRMLRIVNRHFLNAQPHHQVLIDGQIYVLDIAWPSIKLDAEVEGWAVRAGSLSKFDRALRRDNALRRHGWQVVYLTARMNEDDVVAELSPYIPAVLTAPAGAGGKFVNRQ
jgi:very-short-patch-repair endonuclease